MKRSNAFIAAALCALVVGTPPAHAGVLWLATWEFPKPNIISNGGNNQLLLGVPAPFNGDGNASILATHLTVQAPFVGAADSWTAQNYGLDLTLTDLASSQAVTLHFTGSLTGTASPGGSAFTNVFNPSQAVQEVDLGDNHYQAAVGPFTPDGTGLDVGTIAAGITVRPLLDQPEPVPSPSVRDVPEPASLAIACSGVTLTFLIMGRRRRT